MNRKITLSLEERRLIETVRLHGSVEVSRIDWRTFERVAGTGKIMLSEPYGKNNNWKTATMPRTET